MPRVRMLTMARGKIDANPGQEIEVDQRTADQLFAAGCAEPAPAPRRPPRAGELDRRIAPPPETAAAEAPESATARASEDASDEAPRRRGRRAAAAEE